MSLKINGAVVVAQLVERSLLTPEIHGLNPVIGKNLYWMFFVNSIKKTKIKKKRPGLVHFLKINVNNFPFFLLIRSCLKFRTKGFRTLRRSWITDGKCFAGRYRQKWIEIRIGIRWSTCRTRSSCPEEDSERCWNLLKKHRLGHCEIFFCKTIYSFQLTGHKTI